MVHRKKAVDVVGLVAQFMGLVVLISLFFPAVRRVLAELGFMVVCLSAFIVVGLVGFSLYRLATRGNRMKLMTENPFALPPDASVKPGTATCQKPARTFPTRCCGVDIPGGIIKPQRMRMNTMAIDARQSNCR